MGGESLNVGTGYKLAPDSGEMGKIDHGSRMKAPWESCESCVDCTSPCLMFGVDAFVLNLGSSTVYYCYADAVAASLWRGC